jgi:hypothetical protein
MKGNNRKKDKIHGENQQYKVNKILFCNFNAD